MTEKQICSPKKEEDVLDFTCYTSDNLNKLKKSWNDKHGDHKIESNQPKVIWKFLSERYKTSCKQESCWLRQEFSNSNVGKEIMNNSFAPEQPYEWKEKPRQWLDSSNIQSVMRQYENAYPEFEFIGPSPIDYNSINESINEHVWPELVNYSVKNKMNEGIKKTGIIFNLDEHSKPGSHWVALYICYNKKHIYYFDSNSNNSLEDIPKEVLKFSDKIQNEIKNNYGSIFKFNFNKKEHQKQNTECGMYCLYFIIQMLTEEKNWDYFQKNTITDDEMFKYREIFFNKNKL